MLYKELIGFPVKGQSKTLADRMRVNCSNVITLKLDEIEVKNEK